MGIKEIFKYRRSIVVWKILRNFSKKRENHKDDSFKEKICHVEIKKSVWMPL